MTIPPPNCRTNGRGWTLARLIHRSIRFVMKLPLIKIQPFNLSTTVSHESVGQHLKSPYLMFLDKVENIRLSSLTVEPSDISGIHWNSPGDNTGYFCAILTVIIIVGLVLQQLRMRRFGDRQPIITPHAPDSDGDDSIEMTTSPGDALRRSDVSEMPALRNNDDDGTGCMSSISDPGGPMVRWQSVLAYLFGQCIPRTAPLPGSP